MDLQLKDKVVIVTGGAKGIGEAIVRVLAKEGAIPCNRIGRNEADNLSVVDDIIAQRWKCLFRLAAELTQTSEDSERSCEAGTGAIWQDRWIGQ
jgi:L-fucose dehydrogenase